jgi:hypothetical protein
VGKAVARALSDNLVSELRARGIDAHLASKSAPAGETTGSIRGRFLHIDGGDQTMRTVIGFGFRGSQARTCRSFKVRTTTRVSWPKVKP